MLVAVTQAGIWNVPVALGLPLELLRFVTRRVLFFSCCSKRDERHVERPEWNLQLGGKPCRTQARSAETQLTTQVWSINKYLTNTTGFGVVWRNWLLHLVLAQGYLKPWGRGFYNKLQLHPSSCLPACYRALSDNARESIWQTVKICTMQIASPTG